MKAAVMSAGFWDIAEATEPQIRTPKPERTWNRESFAQEQIRGLVRQVFFSQRARQVRQVLFSGIEARTEIRGISIRVGEALASQTRESVVVIGGDPRIVPGDAQALEAQALRNASTLRSNLWLLPAKERIEGQENISSLHSYLGGIREEFEYSIVASPASGESDEALEMAQFVDGVVIVVSAKHTRRVTARRVLETFREAQVRILGTVLSDREFPIPEKLYQWL